MVRLFCIEARGKARYWPEAVVDYQRGQQHQTWNERGQRQNSAQGAVARDLIPVSGCLTNCDAAAIRPVADENAPLAVAVRDGVQTCCDVRRKMWQLRGSVNPRRRVQLFDRDPCLSVNTLLDGRRRVEAMMYGKCSDLKEDRILQLDSFSKRPAKRKSSGGQSRHQNKRSYCGKKARAERGDHDGRSTIHPTPLTLRMAAAPIFLRMAWIRNSTALLSTSSFHP